MATINIDKASFSYPNGQEAVNSISATIIPGESIGIVGSNGAGKTTLARMINGILSPTQGKIFVDDMDTSSTPANLIASKVGYVFSEHRAQFFSKTVYSEIAFGPANLGWDNEKIKQIVNETIDMVGLQDQSQMHPYDLDRDQRQLLRLASAISMRPEVLILDEPTAGADGPLYDRISQILNIFQTQQTTTLIISHDMDFISEHCQRILLLDRGQLLADGSLEQVFSQSDKYGISLPCSARLASSIGGTAYTISDLIALM